MADQVRVQGNLVSWASTVFKILDKSYTGLTEISWDQKRERTKGWGMGKHQAPRGRTSGKYTPGNLKLKVYKDTAQEIREDLAAAAGGTSYGNAEVPMLLQYLDPSDKPITVEFDEAALVSEGDSEKEGGDPSMEDLEFDVMGIKKNGLTLYDNTEGTR